jgi:enoyl-CoA hydratase/carnithine racemase
MTQVETKEEGLMQTDPKPADGAVVVRRDGPIGEVLFNRPDQLNAFAPYEAGDLSETVVRVREGFEELGQDESIKVILFRGVGSAFSTGGNVATLGTMYESPPDDGPRKRPPQRRYLRVDEEVGKTWEAIAESPKVVIAEGKGYVLGVALDWFVAADLLVCSEETILGYPPARMIACSGMSTAFSLLRMGPALHAEIALMGRYLSAGEAKDRGLVNRVVPLDRLDETVQAAADAVCCIAADGLHIGKLNRRVAFNILGARSSLLQSHMGHSMQVQQRLDENEFNMFRTRANLGAKEAWRERDERFKAALERFAPEDFVG